MNRIEKLIDDAQRTLIALKNEFDFINKQKLEEQKVQDAATGEILSYAEVLKYFEISHKTLTDYTKKGVIQPIPTEGRRKFYRKNDVVRLMQMLKPKKYSNWKN